jgi:hypothetical protein
MHAIKLVRSAHDLARNLGFDFRVDGQRTVYKVTLGITSERDARALQYLQTSSFPCVKGVTLGEKEAVLLIDTAQPAPEPTS